MYHVEILRYRFQWETQCVEIKVEWFKLIRYNFMPVAQGRRGDNTFCPLRREVCLRRATHCASRRFIYHSRYVHMCSDVNSETSKTVIRPTHCINTRIRAANVYGALTRHAKRIRRCKFSTVHRYLLLS